MYGTFFGLHSSIFSEISGSGRELATNRGRSYADFYYQIALSTLTTTNPCNGTLER
jgi:hypothetical protein